MSILFWGSIFIISLIILVKAADYFIDGAERVGTYFNIEPFIIGVFILGFGTSLPELAVSILSVIEGSSEVVIGNVLGSNITNIFLVLGVSAIIVKKSILHYNFFEFDLPLFLTTAFLLAVTVWDGIFSIGEGIFFLVLFILYTAYTVSNHKKHKRMLVPEEVKAIPKLVKLDKGTILKLVISPVFIYIGARYTIEAVIYFSEIANIGKDIIAASVIALGTSLPELMVSFSAIRKGKIDEMLGNIIGSNIFNILIVMGISSLMGPLLIPASMLTSTLPIMLIATLTTIIVVHDRKIMRLEGIILISFYLFFLGNLFNIF